jgi:hypothetical protein
LCPVFGVGRLNLYTDPENNRLHNQEAAHLLAGVQAASDDEARREAAAFLAVRAERRTYWTAKLGAAEAEDILEWEVFYEWLEVWPATFRSKLSR